MWVITGQWTGGEREHTDTCHVYVDGFLLATCTLMYMYIYIVTGIYVYIIICIHVVEWGQSSGFRNAWETYQCPPGTTSYHSDTGV